MEWCLHTDLHVYFLSWKKEWVSMELGWYYARWYTCFLSRGAHLRRTLFMHEDVHTNSGRSILWTAIMMYCMIILCWSWKKYFTGACVEYNGAKPFRVQVGLISPKRSIVLLIIFFQLLLTVHIKAKNLERLYVKILNDPMLRIQRW